MKRKGFPLVKDIGTKLHYYIIFNDKLVQFVYNMHDFVAITEVKLL